MISSLRNFVLRILDADRFTIVLFQILDIKSNYLPGIVQAQVKQCQLEISLSPDGHGVTRISNQRSGVALCSSSNNRRSINHPPPLDADVVPLNCQYPCHLETLSLTKC
jgi:hypothetical protein